MAETGRIARKPESLSFAEAASAPVVAVTAWQMPLRLCEGRHARAGRAHSWSRRERRRIRGPTRGPAGLQVFATASSRDLDYVRDLGASAVVDFIASGSKTIIREIDIVLDTVGGRRGNGQ